MHTNFKHIKRNYYFLAVCFCLLTILLFSCNNTSEIEQKKELKPESNLLVPQHPSELMERVYTLNNAFKYDTSRIVIEQYILQNRKNPENLYYAFLNLSFLYKRLFDYHSVLSTLDSAEYYGLKSAKKDFFRTNILCQKALALFDIHRYSESDLLMTKLEKNNYKYLDDEHKGKIMMQQAYLKFMHKDYNEAEARYDKAIIFLDKGSPCDLPMILGKKIQLYGMLKDEVGMLKSLKRLNAVADSCGIVKYRIYGLETLYMGYASVGNFPKAFNALKKWSDLNTEYNQNEHLNKIKEIENQFEITQKTEQIQKQKGEISQKRTLNFLLTAILFIVLLGSIGYYLWQERRRLRQERIVSMRFTKQLLENIEDERKRIASDLHDSISHELLTLKLSINQEAKNVNSKIDIIINDIRDISRNLHPVMFDKTGLVPNLEQLVERIQNQNNFFISTEINYSGSLSSTNELQVYRIIQEAITNIIKYAQAHAAKISILETTEKILVEIVDNGKGFDVKEALSSKNSFGLHNIIERSRVVGGGANIKSSSEGTVITIEIDKLI